LTFVRDSRRSHLSLQERELELKDNIFIIHQNSNHNYENFIGGSYQVGSGRVFGHFRFRVVLGRVGSGIRSFSVGSFRVSGRVSDHLIFGRIRSGRVLGHLVFGHFRF
jgi:hypothetical protein